jgi:hypothetical protein
VTETRNSAGTLESPAWNAAAVTPGVGALAGGVTRALWVGAAGDITVTMGSGASVTFAGIPAGTLMPIRVTHVTTAAGGSVVAMY